MYPKSYPKAHSCLIRVAWGLLPFVGGAMLGPCPGVATPFSSSLKPSPSSRSSSAEFDNWLVRGIALGDVHNPDDRLFWMWIRTLSEAELEPRTRPRGQGWELPREAHQAVAELERIYVAEQKKSKQERRAMEKIVADYVRIAFRSQLTTPLVTPQELLGLWKRTRRKTRGKKGGSFTGL